MMVQKAIYVVIPFKDEPALTCKIISQLSWEYEFMKCFLYDNGSTQDNRTAIENLISLDQRFEIIDAAGMGIYEMWNRGLERAVTHDPDCYVAFLNNDITLPEGGDFLFTLALVLDQNEDAGIAYPNYDLPAGRPVPMGYPVPARETVGTYKDGGMCGWAFMLRSSLLAEGLPLVDEKLQWWFGDDFWESQTRMLGYRVLRAEDLPLDHINEATSRNGANEWTHKAKEEDVAYWYRTYG